MREQNNNIPGPQAMIYPWQQTSWQRLIKRKTNSNIPNGLLIAGPKGNGKYSFALNFARSLLCEQTGDEPCGQCQSCYWFETGSHPDIHEIFPEGKSEVIKVDQIRELCRSLSLTSHCGGYQIGLIYPAERMNVNAANSLLKSLEEPARDTLFILVSHEPGHLPATIRSRCQAIQLHSADSGSAQQWLQGRGIDQRQAQQLLAICSGAPLAAAQYAKENLLEARATLVNELLSVVTDPSRVVTTAEKWSKQDMARQLLWLLFWVNDMIKSHFSVVSPWQHSEDVKNTLVKLNNQVNLTILFKVQDQIRLANEQLKRSANKQMLAESILLSWI